MKLLSQDVKEQLINDYVTSKISISDLCRKYDIKLNDFYIIKGQEEFKKGIELRREKSSGTGHFKKKFKKSEPKKTRKKRKKCEDDFFEFLDIEEAVYWFGFIQLLANLTDDKIQITLPPEDLDHFEKFKTSIESDHTVTILNNGKGMLNIARPRMIQDINNHKKEKTTIPEHLMHHFIRGLFDAKGEFDGETLNFSLILPDKQLAEECQKTLMKECSLEKTPITSNRRRSCFTINYSGDGAKRIMEYLYTDATVYLDRKYEKFQQLRTNTN